MLVCMSIWDYVFDNEWRQRHKPAVPDVLVACAGCGRQVSSTHTTITARGTLCDSCAGV
jgi:hypothetical protein